MAKNKLERINKIVEAFDKESLTQDDFLKAFKTVTDMVVRLREDLNQTIKRMEEAHGATTTRERSDRDNNFKELRSQVNDLFVGDQIKRIGDEQNINFSGLRSKINSLIDEKIQEVDERMSHVKSIKGDPGEQGFQGSPDTAEDILKKLQTVGLDLIIIKEIKKLIKNVHTRLDRMPKIITGRYVHTPIVDRLTASTDGSTKTFILSKAPKDVKTMEVFGTDFPIILDPTVDFTVSGKTLTLTDAVDAPSSGATLIAKYYI